jgi:hypothetical protein
MKLVDDCKTVWKHWSTWALTTVAGVGGTWLGIPDEIKANLPHWVAQGVSWSVFVAGVLGLGAKFKAQNLPPPEDKP